MRVELIELEREAPLAGDELLADMEELDDESAELLAFAEDTAELVALTEAEEDAEEEEVPVEEEEAIGSCPGGY